MTLRGHNPVEFSRLKGLWDRGDIENVPNDHLSDCNNIAFIGDNLRTRYGITPSQDVSAPLEDILRIYNYPTNDANTLLILVDNGDGTASIHHFVNPTTVHGPILTVTGMTDFAFVPYAGRAYLSPFTTYTTGDLNIQRGVENEALYVYQGDGIAARLAGGNPPTGTITIANGAAGHTDAGFHIFGVVFESDTGWLSPPAAFNTFTTSAVQSVSFGSVPVGGGGSGVIKRHIVVTKIITSYNGNLTGYPLFFIPDATIDDNTTTALNNISFFDADLLDDASYLLDNWDLIPAGCALSLYHDRLCISTIFQHDDEDIDDLNIVLISAPGEPEAISLIDGFVTTQPDGNPITNHAELRDVFYVFKRSKTVSFVDNGLEPSSWPLSTVDNSIGTCVHGIATVLDSGSSSVDYFMIASFTGIVLFNGRYILPELTFKIEHIWKEFDKNEYRKIQILNNPSDKTIYCIVPDGRILLGNYANGLDPKNIRWTWLTMLVSVNTVAIWNIDTIIIGSPITTELMS